MDALTSVTLAAAPQEIQSVKWKAYKKLKNKNMIAVRVGNDIFIHCLITIYSFIRSDND
jgi:hypothetical protein